MSKTNIGLVSFVKAALKDGCGYVYGATGQTCTKAFLDQQAGRYPASNQAGGQMRKIGEKWLGKRVVDCSGLVKYYLWADNYGENIKVYDINQDTGMSYGKARVKGPISTLPETPGMLLYMPGHVGVYIGGGEVIEARGTAEGVVKTKLQGRGWTNWWECPFIEYVKEEQKPDSGDIKVGDKVRVKSGAKTYDGGNLASFVYNTVYTVIEAKGDRVVIGLNGVVTAAVKASDLYLDGSAPTKVLEVGAKVRITGNAYTNGAAIPGWVKESTYTVSQMAVDKVLLKEIISWVPIDGVEVV